MGDLEDVDRPGIQRDGLGLAVGGQQHAEGAPSRKDHHCRLVWILSDRIQRRRRWPVDLQVERSGIDLRALRDLERSQAFEPGSG